MCVSGFVHEILLIVTKENVGYNKFCWKVETNECVGIIFSLLQLLVMTVFYELSFCYHFCFTQWRWIEINKIIVEKKNSKRGWT